MCMIDDDSVVDLAWMELYQLGPSPKLIISLMNKLLVTGFIKDHLIIICKVAHHSKFGLSIIYLLTLNIPSYTSTHLSR